MKAKGTLHTALKLLVLGLCSALASAAAIGQSSQTTLTLERPGQKPSSARAILAVVVRQEARVYADSNSSHAIGTFPKGSYLVATGETNRDYCVLVPHNRHVYVAKAGIKLLGYTVPVRHPRQ